DRIARVVEAEERQFARVLENGLGRWRELVGNVGMQHVDKSLKELLDERKNSSELQYYQDELPRHIRSISPGVLRDFYFGNVEPLRYFVGSQLGPGRADEVVNSLREKVSSSEPKIGGADLFKLYETYGLPLDFMTDAARDQR